MGLEQILPDKLDKAKQLLMENQSKFLKEAANPALDKIKNPSIKRAIKTMLEQQGAALHVMKESLVGGANIAPMETYIYPVLTRALPNLIAPEVASMQPINSTYAQVRLLKFEYGANKGKIGANEAALPSFSSNVVFSPYYSGPYVDGEPWNRGANTVSVPATGNVSKNLEYPVAGPVTLTYVLSATSHSIQLIPDGTPVTDGDLTFTLVKNKLTIANANTSTAADFSAIRIYYLTSAEGFPGSADYELTLKKYPIEVEVRYLRAAATLNALLEIAAHSIEFETEMVAVMEQELQVELDRTILKDMLTQTMNAGYQTTFDFSGPTTATAYRPRTIPEYMQNLLLSIAQASAMIFRRTRRAPANWIVTGPEVAGSLESNNLLSISTDGKEYGVYGIVKLGTLARRWKLFVDPLFPPDKILVGLKGQSIYDSGYVYAPYIPAIPVLQPLKDVKVPEGTYHVGVYTAAGWRMIDPGFYHTISITNAPWAGIKPSF